MGNREMIEVELELRQDDESKLSIGFWNGEYFPGPEKKEKWIWLPRSQVSYVPNGKTVTVSLPEWLAEEKELI